jgi:hypothetical protein
MFVFPQEESDAILQADEEAVDASGIPGWDRVDDLAKALIGLEGLAIVNSEANEIERLYNRLVEYDKRPILFKPRPQRPSRGRFSRKKQSGHMSVEAMKRCFLSAGSPASSPSASRLVEAICIRLCDKITQPTRNKLPSGRLVYVSRWKAILSEYNNIRARLLNSHALLERTGLTLYNINESTLTRWYKNMSRVQEVRTLLQGLSLPLTATCASESLPEACTQTSEPQPQPQDPHIFSDVEDTSGQARVRTAKKTSAGPSTSTPHPPCSAAAPGPSTSTPHLPCSAGPGPSSPTIPPLPTQAVGSEVDVESAPRVSRTTEWRYKKTGKRTDQRKTYTCRVCSQPMMSAGHTQFRGQRYCPNAPGQIPKEQWLAARKDEAKAKAAAKLQ